MTFSPFDARQLTSLPHQLAVINGEKVYLGTLNLHTIYAKENGKRKMNFKPPVLSNCQGLFQFRKSRMRLLQ